MNNYYLNFSYSKNGKGWTRSNTTIKAESDTSAMMQLKSKYPYVKDIKIAKR